jgi:hypothetical protein
MVLLDPEVLRAAILAEFAAPHQWHPCTATPTATNFNRNLPFPQI